MFHINTSKPPNYHIFNIKNDGSNHQFNRLENYLKDLPDLHSFSSLLTGMDKELHADALIQFVTAIKCTHSQCDVSTKSFLKTYSDPLKKQLVIESLLDNLNAETIVSFQKEVIDIMRFRLHQYENLNSEPLLRLYDKSCLLSKQIDFLTKRLSTLVVSFLHDNITNFIAHSPLFMMLFMTYIDLFTDIQSKPGIIHRVSDKDSNLVFDELVSHLTEKLFRVFREDTDCKYRYLLSALMHHCLGTLSNIPSDSRVNLDYDNILPHILNDLLTRPGANQILERYGLRPFHPETMNPMDYAPKF